MGIRSGMRSVLVNAPADAIEAIELPKLELEPQLTGAFEYIHLFVKTKDEFHRNFPTLKGHLKPEGVLWVSWPKSGQKSTNLNLTTVIKLGYDYGLVESKCLSINQIWSALKFTHPKEGKIYNNSYGTLKI